MALINDNSYANAAMFGINSCVPIGRHLRHKFEAYNELPTRWCCCVIGRSRETWRPKCGMPVLKFKRFRLLKRLCWGSFVLRNDLNAFESAPRTRCKTYVTEFQGWLNYYLQPLPSLHGGHHIIILHCKICSIGTIGKNVNDLLVCPCSPVVVRYLKQFKFLSASI